MRLLIRSILLGILAFLASTLPLQAAGAGPDSAVEYRVKVAYLYNFTRFIEWPPDAQKASDDEIAICVLGEDPFGATLDSIAGKMVRNKALRIYRHRTIKDVMECQVVFIGSSENGRIGRILMELRKLPILTVGETDNFNQLGGIVQFNLIKQKVRFNINPDAAKRARLSISSKLLNLATIVRESRP